MAKKVSYMGLLKEAIGDVDTSKSVDVKGPMLDPILSYSGGGELPTHKDAASILERYYFKEDEDTGVSVFEDTLAADDNDVDAIPGKDPKKTRADVEKELAKEADAVEECDDSEAVEEAAEVEDDNNDDEAEEVDEGATIELENSVIEKLIAEMEDEEDDEPAEVEESNRVAGDRGTQGEEAMGTNNYDDQVPGRKDITKEAEEGDEEEDEEKDIDSKVSEFDAGADAGTGGGPLSKAKKGGEDEDEVEEAFKIFKEEILDIDDDEIQV